MHACSIACLQSRLQEQPDVLMLDNDLDPPVLTCQYRLLRQLTACPQLSHLSVQHTRADDPVTEIPAVLG